MQQRVQPSPPPGVPDGVLPPEKTRRLLARVRAGDDDARQRLVHANLRLVASVARRFEGRGVEYDDLFQVGCVGLVRAIDGFDLEFDVRFSTYAVPLIMGEIRQYMRDRHPVRLGRTLYERTYRVAGAREQLVQRLGREPTVAEIAAQLRLAPEDVVAALEAGRPVTSLDEPLSGGEDDTISRADVISAPPDPALNVENVVLKEALARLAPWERRLIVLRFFEDKPQTEVARLLGVSQAHVSRTERRLLQHFRTSLT